MNYRKNAVSFLVASVLGIGSATIHAAPGDWINSGPTPLTFTDSATKNTYSVSFHANESTEAGVGGIGFWLNAVRAAGTIGGNLSLSTLHGANLAGTKTFDYSSGSPVLVDAVPPLNISLWEQGNAGAQAVSISAQVAEFSTHSFVHSDAPNIVYLGPVTADVRLERKSEQIKVVIYTPKGQIKLEGRLSGTPVSSSASSTPAPNGKEKDD